MGITREYHHLIHNFNGYNDDDYDGYDSYNDAYEELCFRLRTRCLKYKSRGFQIVDDAYECRRVMETSCSREICRDVIPWIFRYIGNDGIFSFSS